MWKKTGGADIERRLARILHVDPDLAADLDAEMLESATAELIAPVARLEWQRRRGRWGPADPRGHLGLLIVGGLLLREVRLLGASSAEVLGEGDLLRPWDVDADYLMPVPVEVHWTVLTRCDVAILTPSSSAAPAIGRTCLRG